MTSPAEYSATFLHALRDAAADLGRALSEAEADKLARSFDGLKSNRWDSRFADKPSRERIGDFLKTTFAAADEARQEAKHAQTAGIPQDVWDRLSPAERLARYRQYQAGNASPATAKANTPADTLKAQVHALHLRARIARGDARTQVMRDLQAAQTALAELESK